ISRIKTNNKIDPTAVLVPPYFLGTGCVLGPDVIVGPSTIIHDHVTIEKGSKIEHSIVEQGTKVGASSHLHKCVVSEGCTLEQQVTVEKLGVIGSHATLGEGSVVKAGARVGPRIEISPKEVVNDFRYPISVSQLMDPHVQSLALNEKEKTVYIHLKIVGEQTLDGLCNVLDLNPEETKALIENLIQKEVIIQYGDNPTLLALKSQTGI
ncbi:MAG: NDP-sugar synthase, partial [Candidatus Margulisbacteria bacterium]|nr:NDP-sugar synthase [Candidatus Margulisiibacteriota bacterium]